MRSMQNQENVQVTVRCRPPKETENGVCWNIIDKQKIVSQDQRSRKQHEFLFDHVYYGSDNELLYNSSIKNLINQTMEGYNATVFAYGQTASDNGNDQEAGVIPRSVDNVFNYIKKAVTREFLLRVSYLEIYNETIRDLLNPTNDSLKIQQDKIRGVYVTPLTEEVVTSPEDVMRIIERGEANRHISSTDYNLHSSRSHTLFQMVIESRERSSTSTSIQSHRRTLTTSGYGLHSKPKEAVKISQLNLIDLAGSEKAASDEERRKEGSYINKSLLTLGTVISKLTESNKGGHIPFRDSKLTRILQTALSGQAKVAVICTISPTLQSMEESINTLKFASRVKRITIHAKNDEVMDDKALIQKYRNEIAELKSKLQTTNETLQKEKEATESAMLAERRDHDQQIRHMKSVRQTMKERIDHLTRLILTSSSVVMNNNDAIILGTEEGHFPPIPSPPQSEKSTHLAGGLLAMDDVNKEEIIHQLRQQVYHWSQVAKEKDQRILALEEQLRQQASLTSQLETALSVTKAELEVNQLIAKETNRAHFFF